MQLARRGGFTLLETVVVLGLLTTTALIAVVRFPTRQRQLNDETAFWQRLDVLWKRNVLIASTTGQRRMVDFLPTEHMVQFSDRHGTTAARELVRLKLPATLHVLGVKNIPIYKNGHPGLAVVKFASDLTPNKTKRFSPLMGWGAYRVEENEGHRFPDA